MYSAVPLSRSQFSTDSSQNTHHTIHLTNYAPYLALATSEIWGEICDLTLWFIFCFSASVLYETSRYIEQRYNGTRLYISF